MFVFDPKDLVNLLIHYSQGEVPLDSEVKEVKVNKFLERHIGLEIESKDWQESAPLQIRYEGKRIMSWSKERDHEPIWAAAPDAPRNQ